MEYKVLIKLYVPEIEETYEMFIPINKSIGQIAELLCKLVNDLSKAYPIRKNANLCNRNTGLIYDKRSIIKNTDIRNGTELILFWYVNKLTKEFAFKKKYVMINTSIEVLW